MEIFAAPNTDLSVFTLLQIEGDGSSAGTIDTVIALGNTNASGFWETGFLDNEFENGTLTLMLVENFTGLEGDDLDVDDDGILDVIPWDRVVDDVSVFDGGVDDRSYSRAILFPNFDLINPFTPGGASRISDGLDTDSSADWVRAPFDPAGSAILGEADITQDTTNTAQAGLRVRPAGGPLLAEEGGFTTSVSIALNSVPSSEVTVTLTPSDSQIDLGAGAGIPVILTFTAADPFSPQTVTIAADDDAAAEGDHGSLFSVVSASADGDYNGLAFLDIPVGITDNDVAPLIVINEIMQNPGAVADAAGEWFEIFNAGTTAVDIEGWKISDNGTDSHVITNGGPLIIPAGGYLVLGNNADFATNGGITVDYQFSGIALANGDDEIILTTASNLEVDRVEY